MESILSDQQKLEREKEMAKQSMKPHFKKKMNNNAWFGLILIFVGIVFLGNNFGFLDWIVWAELWKLWPLIIIFWGLQSVLGSSFIASVIMFIIVLLTIIALLLSSFGGRDLVPYGDRLDWIPEIVREEIKSSSRSSNGESTQAQIVVSGNSYQGIENRSIELDIGAETFDISSDNSEDHLTLNASLPEGVDEPNVSLSQRNNELAINVSTDSNYKLFNEKGSYTAMIGQGDIPTSVDLDLGSGTGTVDLSGLTLSALDIDQGSGSITVTFPIDQTIEDEISIDLGSGDVTLIISQETGIKVDTNIGSGSVKVFDEQLDRNSEGFETDNYDAAEHNISLDLNVGSGSVVIQSP